MNRTDPDPILMNRTFVIGAGFSAGAGIPLTATLLPRALAIFKIDCPGLYARIEGYARICFGNDHDLLDQDLGSNGFAQLCTFLHYIEMREYGGGDRWSDAGSRENIALRYYLAKAILRDTPKIELIPDEYVAFAEQLDCRDCILTFNWDCLLEAALIRAGKTFTYDPYDVDFVDPAATNRIRLLKMHGSVNWCIESTSFQPDHNWRPLGFQPTFDGQIIYYSDQLRNYINWVHRGPLLEVQPFLVLPGYGKVFDVRKLKEYWDRPGGHFYTTRDVYIIGISLADDDFFVKFFFQESLPLEDWKFCDRKVIIINPSSECIDANYSFIVDDKRIVRAKKFSLEDVNSMIKRRPSSYFTK